MSIEYLVGQLSTWVFVLLGLAAFFVGLLVLVPVLTAVGVSEQAAAGAVGVGVLVGLWAIGLKFLFASGEGP